MDSLKVNDTELKITLKAATLFESLTGENFNSVFDSFSMKNSLLLMFCCYMAAGKPRDSFSEFLGFVNEENYCGFLKLIEDFYHGRG